MKTYFKMHVPNLNPKNPELNLWSDEFTPNEMRFCKKIQIPLPLFLNPAKNGFFVSLL